MQQSALCNVLSMISGNTNILKFEVLDQFEAVFFAVALRFLRLSSEAIALQLNISRHTDVRIGFGFHALSWQKSFYLIN